MIYNKLWQIIIQIMQITFLCPLILLQGGEQQQQAGISLQNEFLHPLH